MAAETVPEYVMSLPIFGPVLMPETTSRGRSGARPRKPSATQSDGEPSLEKPARREPGRRPVAVRGDHAHVVNAFECTRKCAQPGRVDAIIVLNQNHGSPNCPLY